MKTLSRLALWCVAAAMPAAAQEPAPTAFEPPATLRAADLLPAELLRGPSHRVRDLVTTDGFMAHFEIDTDFGSFEAIGVPQAKQRIAEVAAIRKLVETSKGDLFAEGMKRSIEQPIDAVKNIAKDPVGSAKKVPKTVGHFFNKLGASIERGAQRVGDRVNEAANQPADAGEAARDAGRGLGEAAKNVAGFDKAKLETARQLGVDPYSDNAILQAEMEKVTWAFFAGGLPLRIGAAAVSAGVALTATNMVGIPEDVYARTSSELALRDRNALAAIGVEDGHIREFQLNPALSTTRRHRLVAMLGAMPKASGRGNIILLANACTTPEQADFLVSAVALLAGRQQAGSANYVALQVLGRLPAATTAEGELQVPAPVDHVTWTETVAGFANRDDLGARPRVLLHTGVLSPATTAGLTAAGWRPLAVPYP